MNTIESTYRIVTSTSHQSRAWDATYETQEDAAAALRIAMGWDEIVLSDSYTTDDGEARSAFATQADCDADERNPSGHAPRVEEIGATRIADTASLRAEYPEASEDEIAYFLATAEKSIG